MKKKNFLVVTLFSIICALFFVSCTQVHRDITPILDNKLIKEFGEYEPIRFEELGITQENAKNFILKITYDLYDETKKNWGPGCLKNLSWEHIIFFEGVDYSGVYKYEISDIITLTDSFFIQWWGGADADDYAELKKCEIIKK